MFKLWKHKQARLRRNLYLLPANEFLGELRFYYPVAVLAYEAIAGSYTAAMAVFAFIYIVQAALEIPTGILSDRWGRRKTFILGSLLEVIGSFCLVSAFFLPHGIWYLYAGGISAGAAYSLFSGNNHALIYETLAYYRRTDLLSTYYGRTSSMGQTALAISGAGAAIALWFGLDYKHLMIATLVPSSISFLFALLTVEPPHIMKEGNTLQHMKEGAKLIIKNPELRALALTSAWASGIGEIAHSFTPGFIASVWPRWAVPIFSMAQNVISAVFFWFTDKVLSKFGMFRSLFFCSALSYGTNFIAYALANVASPFLMLLTRPFYSITTTAKQTLQQERFSDEQRSTMGSIIAFMGSIIGGVGAICTGLLADTFGPAQALIILLLIASPVLIVYYWLFKKN